MCHAFIFPLLLAIFDRQSYTLEQPLVKKKILIMGLPGAGKSTLARILAPRIPAVWFNADDVRTNLYKGLGFSLSDRIEHARRMGWLCDRVAEAGGTAIADFICPTPETRAAFGDAFVVFVDRIQAGRFEETNRLFVRPESYDLRVDIDGAPDYWADAVLHLLQQRADSISDKGIDFLHSDKYGADRDG